MTNQTPATKIEIIGVKGMKSLPFRKVFKDQAAFEKWFEKNSENVSIHATREAE